MSVEEKSVVIPDFTELEFDEEKHQYKFCGVVIPSVSEVMEPLSKSKYEGIREDVLDKAARKGTSVHDAIETYIKFDIEDIASEHQGYFDGFLEWWKNAKPIPVASEVRLYHKVLLYGGTADLLAYIDGKLTLIDFKTTCVISDMTCGVQLEAYAQALESHGIHIESKKILHLKKDGKWAIIDYPVNDSKRWRVFGSLKCVYDYLKSYK